MQQLFGNRVGRCRVRSQAGGKENVAGHQDLPVHGTFTLLVHTQRRSTGKQRLPGMGAENVRLQVTSQRVLESAAGRIQNGMKQSGFVALGRRSPQRLVRMLDQFAKPGVVGRMGGMQGPERQRRRLAIRATCRTEGQV